MHKITGKEALAEIGAKAPSTQSSETQPTGPTPPDLPPQALDLIAATMTATFGSRWTAQHGANFADTSGRVWASGLAGLTPRQIQRGLALAKQLEWPPVLADFKAACLGALPIETVILQRRGKPADQSPFTVLVGNMINHAEWRMAAPERQERILERAWREAKQHLLNGGKLPAYIPAAQQLTKEDTRPPPPPIMVTPAEAIGEIREMLRMSEPEAKPEPKGLSPCVRCAGLRVDPEHEDHPLQTETGNECIACFGSGSEHSFNRIVHQDGTIEERL